MLMTPRVFIQNDAPVGSSRYGRVLGGVLIVVGVVSFCLAGTAAMSGGTATQKSVKNTVGLDAEACDFKPADFKLTTIKAFPEQGQLKFENIGTVGDQAVDMEINANGDAYVNNGKITDDGFGSINCDHTKKSSFTVSFYKSGTSDAMEIPAFAFTLYDVDGAADDLPEVVVAHGFSGYTLGKGYEAHDTVQARYSTVQLTSKTLGVTEENPTSLFSL